MNFEKKENSFPLALFSNQNLMGVGPFIMTLSSVMDPDPKLSEGS
jgi:hypothetical protein